MSILTQPVKTGLSIISAVYVLEITVYQLIKHLQQLEWIYEVNRQWQPSIVFTAESYIEPYQLEVRHYREGQQEMSIPQIRITPKGMSWLRHYLRR